MLRWRLVGAFAILVPVFFMLWLDIRHSGGMPGVWLIPIGLLFSVLGPSELMMLRTAKQWTPDVGTTAIGGFIAGACMLVPVVHHPADCPMGTWGWTVLGLFLAMAFVAIVSMRKLDTVAPDSLPHAAFSIFYVVLPLSFLLQLRLLHHGVWGIAAITSIVAVVKLSDAGAYFVGRSLGRRPLAARLSPKKTVEGAIGGVIVAVIAAIGLHLHLLPWLFQVEHADSSLSGIGALAVYGALIAIAGIFGDLAESYLKRSFGQKDSAQWLPGLGGCLDILDSVLWAAPVGYLWWAAGLIGG